MLKKVEMTAKKDPRIRTTTAMTFIIRFFFFLLFFLRISGMAAITKHRANIAAKKAEWVVSEAMVGVVNEGT